MFDLVIRLMTMIFFLNSNAGESPLTVWRSAIQSMDIHHPASMFLSGPFTFPFSISLGVHRGPLELFDSVLPLGYCINLQTTYLFFICSTMYIFKVTLYILSWNASTSLLLLGWHCSCGDISIWKSVGASLPGFAACWLVDTDAPAQQHNTLYL